MFSYASHDAQSPKCDDIPIKRLGVGVLLEKRYSKESLLPCSCRVVAVAVLAYNTIVPILNIHPFFLENNFL